jgi:hypothetical protein
MSVKFHQCSAVIHLSITVYYVIVTDSVVKYHALNNPVSRQSRDKGLRRGNAKGCKLYVIYGATSLCFFLGATDKYNAQSQMEEPVLVKCKCPGEIFPVHDVKASSGGEV